MDLIKTEAVTSDPSPSDRNAVYGGTGGHEDASVHSRSAAVPKAEKTSRRPGVKSNGFPSRCR